MHSKCCQNSVTSRIAYRLKSFQSYFSLFQLLFINTHVFNFQGQPQPGAPGGGASPFAAPTLATGITPQQFALAISLVPIGLTPVAVFPPFETPRTIEAVAVIFSEEPETLRLKKRSLARKVKSYFRSARAYLEGDASKDKTEKCYRPKR